MVGQPALSCNLRDAVLWFLYQQTCVFQAKSAVACLIELSVLDFVGLLLVKGAVVDCSCLSELQPRLPVLPEF